MIEKNASVQQLAQEAQAEFQRRFGRAPRWVTVAPGRVNLIGEHTDYNDGFVLPMAIERYVVLAADPSPARAGKGGSGSYSLCSMTSGKTQSWPADGAPPGGKGDWTSYVWGVLDLCQQRALKTGPLDIVVHSTVPVGGGLSSSAALEVAAATLVEAVTGHRLDPVEKALLCQQAEHEYAGVPCGIMDQFTSILARENHALLLDCRSRTTTPVAMSDPAVTVLIINTNIRHKLAESEYAKRRSQCEAAARALGVAALRDASLGALEAARARMDSVPFRRARHVISENERTLQTAKAIQASDWSKVGQLMYASHTSLREDYEVSCPELDTVVEIAHAIGAAGGVIGCRMTGGGFGGCAVSLVQTEAVQRITRKLEELYEKRTGRQPAIFSSRPAGGARVLRSS